MAAEKECEICGIYFVPRNGNQKYCPDCGRKPDQAKKRLEMAMRESVSRAGLGYTPKVVSVCKQCGKEFETYVDIRRHPDFVPPDFCSRGCRHEYTIANTKCGYCGKLMSEAGVHEYLPKGWFCSDDCRKASARKAAQEAGLLGVCSHCGKEYIAHKQINTSGHNFCSMDCRRQYTMEHTVCLNCGKPMMETSAREYHPSGKWFCSDSCKNEYEWKDAEKNGWIRTCRECGKKYPSKDYKPFCSKECYKAFVQSGKQITTRNKKMDKTLMVPKKKVVLAKEIQTRKDVPKGKPESICSQCRTSYRDCELMQTNFRIAPKGAIWDGYKIVSCPKYTKSKS